jgi:hypothetical protein
MSMRAVRRPAKQVTRNSGRASLREALAAARRFDAIMRNTFRKDPITLAAWKALCRVPRQKKQDV